MRSLLEGLGLAQRTPGARTPRPAAQPQPRPCAQPRAASGGCGAGAAVPGACGYRGRFAACPSPAARGAGRLLRVPRAVGPPRCPAPAVPSRAPVLLARAPLCSRQVRLLLRQSGRGGGGGAARLCPPVLGRATGCVPRRAGPRRAPCPCPMSHVPCRAVPRARPCPVSLVPCPVSCHIPCRAVSRVVLCPCRAVPRVPCPTSRVVTHPVSCHAPCRPVPVRAVPGAVPCRGGAGPGARCARPGAGLGALQKLRGARVLRG